MKGFIRFLLGLFAPFILVFGGAGLVGAGAKYRLDFLIWTGFAVIAAGIIWGLVAYFMNGSVSLFD